MVTCNCLQGCRQYSAGENDYGAGDALVFLFLANKLLPIISCIIYMCQAQSI